MELTSNLRRARELGLKKTLKKAPSYLTAKYTIEYIWSRTDLLSRKDLRKKGELHEFGNEETVRIGPLADPVTVPDSFTNITGTYHSDRPFTCDIGPVRLVGEQPLGVTSEGEVIVETAEGDKNNLKWRIFDYILSEGPLTARQTLNSFTPSSSPDFERVFPLVRYPDVTTTYYHWMLGYAYKVRALEEYTERTGNEPTILIQRDAPSWVDESLELLGCDPESCVRWSGETAEVRSLVVPSHNIRSPGNYNPSKEECKWIKNRMQNSIDIGHSSGNKRIYISRRDADRRHVLNESAVLDTVAEFGFQPYLLSDLTVREQVRLFSNAEVIVGPHGAGFTNMIFSDQASVVELFPESRIRPFFFALAQESGLDYQYLVCKDNDSFDITVDTEELGSLLKEMLNAD